MDESLLDDLRHAQAALPPAEWARRNAVADAEAEVLERVLAKGAAAFFEGGLGGGDLLVGGDSP